MTSRLYSCILSTLLAFSSLSTDVSAQESCRDQGYSLFGDECFISIDPCYSATMLDRLRCRPYKHLLLMEQQGCDPDHSQILLSAQLRATALYVNASDEDKFGYLGRFSSDFNGTSGSVADINDFTLALTYSPLSCLHLYWEFLHSDHITFAASKDDRQGANHTQKVYAVLGNTACYPWYMTIGKRDIGFGAMHTVNPFSPSITWHYFGALHDGVSLGYAGNSFLAEITAINGGRGIRVTDTNKKGSIDNWAINTNYTFCTSYLQISVGAAYLHSTMFDGKPPEHTGPESIGDRNGAWNLNLVANYCNWEGYVEFTATEKNWESTKHPVRTISGGLSYCWEGLYCCNPLTLSIEYGEGVVGESGTQWRKNSQAVVGLNYEQAENVQFTFEYVHTHGFAPLIDLTQEGVSKSNATSDLFQIGLVINM